MMRQIFRKFLLLTVSAPMLWGCSYSVHQVYVGSMDPTASFSKGKIVTAEATDFVILGFAAQSDYVDQAVKKLEQKCSGRISQVTTRYLTSFKFLSYEQKVILKGLCIS